MSKQPGSLSTIVHCLIAIYLPALMTHYIRRTDRHAVPSFTDVIDSGFNFLSVFSLPRNMLGRAEVDMI